MLLDRESLPRAVELLKPADFYKEGHRKIFDAMLALFERNEPVDLLTISEELRRRSELDEVGGPASLGALVEEAATAAHLLSYGGIVREKAVLRDLIRIATEIIGKSYDGRDDVEKVPDDAERLRSEGVRVSGLAGSATGGMPGTVSIGPAANSLTGMRRASAAMTSM